MLEKFNSEAVYNELNAKAAAVGCSLSDICAEVGTHRNTVQNWKKKPPRSFVLLGKLLSAIEAKTPVAPPAV